LQCKVEHSLSNEQKHPDAYEPLVYVAEQEDLQILPSHKPEKQSVLWVQAVSSS
jgi:hypothetical protein